MSDESTPQGEQPVQPDAIAQLKGETHRKLDNVNAQVDALRQQNALMLEKLSSFMNPRPAPQAQAEDLSTLIYSDPAKALSMVKEQAKAEISAELQVANAAQARTNSILAEISNDYPELNDKDSDLTKKAVEIYSKMGDHEKSNPISYKLAAREAAMELGVKPRSKRTDEDFTGPGSGGGSRPSSSRQQKARLDPATEEWARLLGVDIDDPSVKERIIKRSERQWGKYQQPLPIAKKGGRK